MLISTYRLFLIDHVFGDELGDELLNTYGKGTRVLTDWFREDVTAPWFDNITTPDIEVREDMVRKTLQTTVVYLKNRYGSNLDKWQWGNKHRVVLLHTFSSITNLFDIGGDPAPGSSNTVNAIAGPSWNGGDISFISSYGPYFRLVTDVENTWSTIWVQVSSGASQNPLSDHYSDAYEEWIALNYHHWHSSLEDIMANYKHTAVYRSEQNMHTIKLGLLANEIVVLILILLSKHRDWITNVTIVLGTMLLLCVTVYNLDLIDISQSINLSRDTILVMYLVGSIFPILGMYLGSFYAVFALSIPFVYYIIMAVLVTSQLILVLIISRSEISQI